MIRAPVLCMQHRAHCCAVLSSSECALRLRWLCGIPALAAHNGFIVGNRGKERTGAPCGAMPMATQTELKVSAGVGGLSGRTTFLLPTSRCSASIAKSFGLSPNNSEETTQKHAVLRVKYKPLRSMQQQQRQQHQPQQAMQAHIPIS